MKLSHLVLYCTIALSLLACTTTIQYTPNTDNLMIRQEAEGIIEQVSLEQPQNFSVVGVKLFDKYFQIMKNPTKRSFAAGGTTAYSKVETIYYDNINTMSLKNKKRLFYVFIYDSTGATLARIATTQESKGKKLIDALSAMKQLTN